MPLDALLSVVVPVFAFIALGYAVIRGRILGEDTGDALADFVFTIAVPCLLFRSLGTMQLPPLSPWPFWGTYFGGVALTIATAVLLTERGFGRDARAGVIGAMSASFSNLIMVGVPVVNQAFGQEGLVTLFMLITIHLPVMMTISALMIEFAEHRDGTAAGRLRVGAALRRVARGLARNPLVIAIVAGLAFRATGLSLTGIARDVIDRIAATAIPLALVALGMSLHRYGVRGNAQHGLALGALKLLVLPGVVYALGVHVFALPPVATAVAVLAAACPTGVNAYLIAARFQTGLALSANTISITTGVSILTFTFWLAVVGI